MKTRSFQLRQGQLVETQAKPAASAKLRAKVSARFSRTGKDLVFQKMRERFKQASKRKLRQAA